MNAGKRKAEIEKWLSTKPKEDRERIKIDVLIAPNDVAKNQDQIGPMREQYMLAKKNAAEQGKMLAA